MLIEKTTQNMQNIDGLLKTLYTLRIAWDVKNDMTLVVCAGSIDVAPMNIKWIIR